MRRMRQKRVIYPLGALAVIGLAVLFVPVTPWVQTQLIALVAEKGIQGAHFKVTRLGMRGIELEDFSIGEGQPFALRKVIVEYALKDLRSKQIGGITLEGLKLSVYQENGVWGVHGLESLSQRDGSKTPRIPVTRAELDAMPLSSLTVKDSALVADTPDMALDMPLAGTFQLKPDGALHYEAPELALNVQNTGVETGAAVLDATLDVAKDQWNGTWEIKDISIGGLMDDLPALTAKGTLLVEASRILLKGSVTSRYNDYKASFQLNYDLERKDKTVLQLSNVRMPWNGGVVGVDAATIPLGVKKASQLTLVVKQVSIEALMKSLTGERATGTGNVSGSVPLVITSDGDILFRGGKLAADAPGTIAIAPETIPGDNTQVKLVRDVLHNLHYNLLSIAVQSDKEKNLSVDMSVEGKNPDLPGGRPVRLNVHLRGDVLNLIRQNVMAVSNPEQLLEKRNDSRD